MFIIILLVLWFVLRPAYFHHPMFGWFGPMFYRRPMHHHHMMFGPGPMRGPGFGPGPMRGPGFGPMHGPRGPRF